MKRIRLLPLACQQPLGPISPLRSGLGLVADGLRIKSTQATSCFLTGRLCRRSNQHSAAEIVYRCGDGVLSDILHREDCLIYDTAKPYKYIWLTGCNETDDYMVIGGCDHKVGQETAQRLEELTRWVRERFSAAGEVDYAWRGQVMEPVDYMAFIGKNQGKGRTLVADEIEGCENPWATLYHPRRTHSIRKSITGMFEHDLQVNAQYKRWVQSDIRGIADIVPGEGGVLHQHGKPVAVYRDQDGNQHKLSAICPHMKGVVCWNGAEKSWDCPVQSVRATEAANSIDQDIV